jgi:hypothetical protein
LTVSPYRAGRRFRRAPSLKAYCHIARRDRYTPHSRHTRRVAPSQASAFTSPPYPKASLSINGENGNANAKARNRPFGSRTALYVWVIDTKRQGPPGHI